MHAPFEATAHQRQCLGPHDRTSLGHDRTDGRGSQSGQITAIHNRQRHPSFGVVIDLHPGHVGQITLVVLGKAANPFQAASPQLVQVGRHCMKKVGRIGVGGVHANLGMHFIRALGMFAQGLLHDSHDLGRSKR